MKQFISICLIVLMLATVLVGCTGGKNVSDNTNGSITDGTESTPSSILESTRETTRETTHSTTNSTTSSTTERGSENNTSSEGNGNAPRGLGVNERF